MRSDPNFYNHLPPGSRLYYALQSYIDRFTNIPPDPDYPEELSDQPYWAHHRFIGNIQQNENNNTNTKRTTD